MGFVGDAGNLVGCAFPKVHKYRDSRGCYIGTIVLAVGRYLLFGDLDLRLDVAVRRQNRHMLPRGNAASALKRMTA